DVGRDKGFGTAYEKPYPVAFCGLLRLGGKGRGEEDECATEELLDDLVRPRQDRLRDREAEGPGRLEVDHQFELRGLLDGEVGRLGTFQDLVDIQGCPLVQVVKVRAI